jgi:hypothetical protein
MGSTVAQETGNFRSGMDANAGHGTYAIAIVKFSAIFGVRTGGPAPRGSIANHGDERSGAFG